MTHASVRRVFRWAVLGGLLALVFVSLELASPLGGQSQAGPAAADFGQWTSIGPSHITAQRDRQSGRVTSVAIDPADPNHWLIGAALGGVWETRDAGSTWQTSTDGQPSLAIGAIAFAPGAPDVVYAGTGEANFEVYTFAGEGMLRSADGGVTWTLVNAPTFAKASVKAILVHPADSNIVLAGTARGHAGRDLGTIWSPPLFGVQRSTDGGQTWTHLLTGQISAMVGHPDDFSRQYAAIGDSRGNGQTNGPGDFQPGTMPNGLYRTTDTGNTWTPVAGPWMSLAGGAGYIALAVSPSNPDVMYASVEAPWLGSGRPGGLLGLFRTNNAWAATPDWIQVPDVGGESTYCTSLDYAHILSVDPSDADTLFTGCAIVWRCRNCAANPEWSRVTQTGTGATNVHVDSHALVWVGNRLIIANDGGIYSTLDRGATWQQHNIGLPLLQLYGGAVHPTRADLILANTQDNNVVKSNGSVALWTGRIGGNVAEGDVAMSFSRPDTDWATTHTFRAIGRTTDGGASFQHVEAGVDLTGAPFFVRIENCPANDDVVLVGTNRVWRSNDFFSAPMPTWSVNSPRLDTAACAKPGRGPDQCLQVLAIEFVPSDGTCNTYAYGNLAGDLRATTNGGASWSDVDPADGVPPRPVTAVAFAPADPNVAYVTISGFDEDVPLRGSARPGHVFRTMNARSASPTWTDVSPPANLPFNALAVDPSAPGTVYAGADNGVWASRDAGATWAYMGPESGLPNTAVFDLQIQASTGKVFAFTFGRGAFVLTPAAAATP